MRNISGLSFTLTLCFILAAAAPGANGANITYTDLYTIGVLPGYGFPNPIFSAGGQVVGFENHNPLGPHAILWSPAAPAGTDINPSGFNSSFAYFTDGAQQAGHGAVSSGAGTHAIFWSGSAATAVDLNPTGFTESSAYGASGTQQVGYGISPATTGYQHALVWSGTAANAVDLNPIGFTASSASGTDGFYQAGWASVASTGGNMQATLWSGSAYSAVNLNPSGFTSSIATLTSNGQQVGYGSGPATGGFQHALLWSGTAASAIDLDPANFSTSTASGTNGTQQVGWGVYLGTHHALLWSGTAQSYVDLGAVLPSTFRDSFAYSISGETVYGIAQDTSGNYHAITWTVPEPAGIALIALLAMTTLALTRKRRRSGPASTLGFSPPQASGCALTTRSIGRSV